MQPCRKLTELDEMEECLDDVNTGLRKALGDLPNSNKA